MNVSLSRPLIRVGRGGLGVAPRSQGRASPGLPVARGFPGRALVDRPSVLCSPGGCRAEGQKPEHVKPPEPGRIPRRVRGSPVPSRSWQAWPWRNAPARLCAAGGVWSGGSWMSPCRCPPRVGGGTSVSAVRVGQWHFGVLCIWGWHFGVCSVWGGTSVFSAYGGGTSVSAVCGVALWCPLRMGVALECPPCVGGGTSVSSAYGGGTSVSAGVRGGT